MELDRDRRKLAVRKSNNEPVLTREEFHTLANVPPEAEWFGDIQNPNTRRAYENDVREFARFVGISRPEDFRIVTRAHVLAWRKQLKSRELAPATIRRKLSALSSLMSYLCDSNAISFNPVGGVSRPKEGSNEGKTPAIADSQAKKLLEAPDCATLKGLRDRAILSVLLFHALRVGELVALRVRDVSERRGVPHFRVLGKGGRIRYVPIHAGTAASISEYLGRVSHSSDELFRSLKRSRPLDQSFIYQLVRRYAVQVGIKTEGFCIHSLRATAATNALDNGADIAKVQEWLGHQNISTTRLYDRRKTKPEESPTFRVRY